jgi:hypothetical protein
MRIVRIWLTRWRVRRERRHRSRWDANGHDVLAEMLENDRLRKSRRLP